MELMVAIDPIRLNEVLVSVSNVSILKVAHHTLGFLLQHRHVLVGGVPKSGLGSYGYAFVHFLLQVRIQSLPWVELRAVAGG